MNNGGIGSAGRSTSSPASQIGGVSHKSKSPVYPSSHGVRTFISLSAELRMAGGVGLALSRHAAARERGVTYPYGLPKAIYALGLQ